MFNSKVNYARAEKLFVVCPPVTLEWSFCSAKGAAASALHLNGKWAQDKNTGAWPELIWILMAIWLAGHAKQGGRTFIRGTDPTALSSTPLGAATAAGCSGDWLSTKDMSYDAFTGFWMTCILFIKRDKSMIREHRLLSRRLLWKWQHTNCEIVNWDWQNFYH